MTEEPEELVENFFRLESASLVAVLTRAFGFPLIDVVEDMVQQAMLEALRVWRINGVPDNPAGWLHRVARNKIIDVLRHDRKRDRNSVEALAVELPGDQFMLFDSDELQDSLLRMIFACCHPTLDRQSQLALTLKVLCGLGDQEIGRGLLISASAAKKRVTRAKQHLQLNQFSLDLPVPEKLMQRLETVHEVLYLMFNEGYSATRGDLPVRIDLCEEAVRLCHLLCESDLGLPTTRALLALMLFHAARFESRLNDSGSHVLLADQDRSLWDRDMMRVAEYWLVRSAEGGVSRFHLEAGIARIHCNATSIAETDWDGIVRHYDALLKFDNSPIYTLNRAVALGQLGRVEEGISALRSIERNQSLKRYPLFHCAMADLLVQSNRPDQAIEHWQLALNNIHASHDKKLIEARIAKTQSTNEY